MSIRSALERCVRNVRIRRRLPREFGAYAIWTSPDARLRYLWPSRAAFDIALLRRARSLIYPGQVVYDIGANVGEFSLAASYSVGTHGAVLAFEPDPFLCSLLHRTIAEPSNAGLPLIAMCAAVAEKDGFSTFQIAARGRASNALAGHGTPTMGGVRGEFIAPVFALDSISRSWRTPDFIKIDVEGAEHRVLDGARKTISQHRPGFLLEVTAHHAEIGSFFGQNNYQLFELTFNGELQGISRCAFDTIALPNEKVPAFIARMKRSVSR